MDCHSSNIHNRPRRSANSNSSSRRVYSLCKRKPPGQILSRDLHPRLNSSKAFRRFPFRQPAQTLSDNRCSLTSRRVKGGRTHRKPPWAGSSRCRLRLSSRGPDSSSLNSNSRRGARDDKHVSPFSSQMCDISAAFCFIEGVKGGEEEREGYYQSAYRNITRVLA